MSDALIAALEEAGVPSRGANLAAYDAERPEVMDGDDCFRVALATDADRILPVLLKYAGVEVRREVLRELLGERFAEMGESEAARLYGHKTTDLLNASAKYWLDQIAPAPEVGS